MSSLKQLSAEIAADPDLAWAYYCNISVPIMDAAHVSNKIASETAAHLMQHLFGYDMTSHQKYEYGKSEVQQYAELRIAVEAEEDDAILKQGIAQ